MTSKGSDDELNQALPSSPPSPPRMENQIAALSLAPIQKRAPIPLAVTTDTPPPWEYDLCVIGTLLTKRDINFQTMCCVLSKAWRPGRGVEINELEGGLYLFRCNHSLDVRRIMDDEPWSFDGHLLLTHELQSEETPDRFHSTIWLSGYRYISCRIVTSQRQLATPSAMTSVFSINMMSVKQFSSSMPTCESGLSSMSAHPCCKKPRQLVLHETIPQLTLLFLMPKNATDEAESMQMFVPESTCGFPTAMQRDQTFLSKRHADI
ncbi:hypothetical protein LINGRAHAP2_LOCUS9864 [Linum grandiflorum]